MGDKDIVIWNGTYQNGSVYPSPVVFQETRTPPVLEEPAKFRMTVLTFSVDLTRTPIFTAIPRATLTPAPWTPTSVDDLQYYVQITWTGHATYTQFLSMVSVNTWNKPIYVSETNNYSNESYYAITSYGQFIGMINDATYACFLQLVAGGYPGNNAAFPYITRNVDTGIVGLVFSQDFFANNVTMVFSDDLMDVLNLPFNQVIKNNPIAVTPNEAYFVDTGNTVVDLRSYVPMTTSRDFLGINLYNATYPTNLAWSTPAFVILTDRDYSSLWYDVYEIVLLSDLAAPESISKPSMVNSVQRDSFNILSKYTVDIAPFGFGGQIIYNPPFPIYTVLTATTPLTQITIKMFYGNRSGKYFPLLQNFGRIATVRIMFERIKETLYQSLKRHREDEENPTNQSN